MRIVGKGREESGRNDECAEDTPWVECRGQTQADKLGDDRAGNTGREKKRDGCQGRFHGIIVSLYTGNRTGCASSVDKS